jgi:predicted amidohydrolase
MNPRIFLIQMTSTDNTNENFKKIIKYLHEAKSQSADLVALPENFAFFGRDIDKIANLEKIQSLTQNFLRENSKKYGLAILAGGYPVASPDEEKAFNRVSIYSKLGEEIFNYDKMHLFDSEPGDGFSYKESKTTYPGHASPRVINISGIGRLSSVICYDLRFPEIFRKISEQQVDFIFVPAAFTKHTGIAHWEILLRARAIENSVFIIAPGQTGVHDFEGKRKTFGNSMVVSPWGQVILNAGEKEGVFGLEIPFDQLSDARQKIPSLNHRKIF